MSEIKINYISSNLSSIIGKVFREVDQPDTYKTLALEVLRNHAKKQFNTAKECMYDHNTPVSNIAFLRSIADLQHTWRYLKSPTSKAGLALNGAAETLAQIYAETTYSNAWVKVETYCDMSKPDFLRAYNPQVLDMFMYFSIEN